MRKLFLILTLGFIPLAVFAPQTNQLALITGDPVNPYLRIAIAISEVESDRSDTAVNRKEQAFGRFQARQIMLNQYNNETGHNFSLEMMKDSTTATKVFLHHANKYHYTDIESISRTWNGGMTGMSKTSTLSYYLLVLEEMNKK